MNPFENILSAVRQKRPLVHFITNYVTVNDCANMTLALGGSPIMADELREVEQIVGHCSALVLNIGTLSERTVQSMLAAGKEANRLGRPVVFDPVGVGASRFRNETAAMLLREVRFDVIKGNISEIAYLAEGIGTTKGVDANLDALSTEGNLRWHTDLARKVSTQTGAAIVISGPIDIVADSHEAWAIRNGHPMMANITGTGCMSAGVIGCCVGADPQALLPSCVCAMSAMGICGELAYEKLLSVDGGSGTYRVLGRHEQAGRGDADPQEQGGTVADLRLRRAGRPALYPVGKRRGKCAASMRRYPSGWIGFCRLRGFLFRIGDGIAPQLLLG